MPVDRVNGKRFIMRGFTLIEFIVVIVLVAALAFHLLPRSDGGALSLRAQADQMVADIRYTQALAMTEGARRRININVPGSYEITDQAGAGLPHPTTGVIGPITLAGGVAIAATTNAFIVFDGRGRPYSDAATPGAPLAADAVITLTAEGQNRQVRVSPETGRVVQQ